MPLTAGKCSPPANRMEVLDVVFDTTDMSTSFPDRELVGPHTSLRKLLSRSKCTQRALLSVVGRSVHASKCVPPGRAFPRRLLDAAYPVVGLQ